MPAKQPKKYNQAGRQLPVSLHSFSLDLAKSLNSHLEKDPLDNACPQQPNQAMIQEHII